MQRVCVCVIVLCGRSWGEEAARQAAGRAGRQAGNSSVWSVEVVLAVVVGSDMDSVEREREREGEGGRGERKKK